MNTQSIDNYERNRRLALAILVMLLATLAICAWTWPEFRAGLGAALFFCGMISGACGAFTMSARNGAAAAGLLGGIAAILVGWALLTMAS